ncbi:MAG: hypothetical protein K5883_04110 [Pseudobutyrivibrio sp.]|nr:hypothetical protein [Pseudobutyrivibrio sp.]
MKNKVIVKDKDEWSSLANFIGNIIAKYADEIDYQRKNYKGFERTQYDSGGVCKRTPFIFVFYYHFILHSYPLP